MGGATREFYLKVVREALGVLEGAAADHLVIGSMAVRALLGKPLSEAEDVDVLIRVEDAERLLDAFSTEGYTTYRRDERWIYKAARPNVTVDLIFRAGESIRLDDDHLARSTTAEIDGISLPVPAPEDLVVMKAVFDAEDRQGAWYDALSILRRFPVDWDYLAERALAHGPRRLLGLLLYASDAGIDVPDRAVSILVPEATATKPDEAS